LLASRPIRTGGLISIRFHQATTDWLPDHQVSVLEIYLSTSDDKYGTANDGSLYSSGSAALMCAPAEVMSG
jgi:hypothetical protein